MTFFVYNHKITGIQELIEAESIANDHEIIYSGTTIKFNPEHIGGLKLVDGELVYDETLKTKNDNKKRKASRLLEIDSELQKIDIAKIRPAANKIMGKTIPKNGISVEDDKLINLEAQAEVLRQERKIVDAY